LLRNQDSTRPLLQEVVGRLQLVVWKYSKTRPAKLFVPLLVTLLTTTPVEPPYSAPYWCVCTWYSAIESSEIARLRALRAAAPRVVVVLAVDEEQVVGRRLARSR
jgi:hypothetical protein